MRAIGQALGGAAAVGLTLGAAGCTKEAAEGSNGEAAKLNFYTWDTYIGKTTLADFKAATGIDVAISLYANNDELFAKMKAGNPGFDVVVPSNEFVQRMALAGMLQKLDHALLPNMGNIDAAFADPDYDRGRQYSLPYTWLVTGIGYRRSKVDGVPDSWKWLFDSDRYKGRIALVGEAGDLIRIGAKYLGHSVNGIDQAMIDRVAAMLLKQRPNIKAFHDDNGQDLLAAGDVDLVMEYNGDIAQIMQDDPDIGFVIPKEGSLINSDNLCIPTGAPRPKNAHLFLNYLLDAKAGAEISKTILYPTPNVAAKALMPPGYAANPVIFPAAATMARCEYGRFEGPDYSRAAELAITRVRA